MPQLFDRVAIAGVGLIGGSLGLAARAAGLVGEVVGYGRNAANLQTARERGIIDRYSHDPCEAARDADLLVLAVPVRAMPAVARACAPTLRADAVVTDVGSVKASVVREVEAALPPSLSFVGAHPIAGTEASGAAAANAELFRGRRCIVTTGKRADETATAKIRALWEGVGMQVEVMDATRHDQILAWVSHLPHALAYSAVNALLDVDGALQRFAGPSFRDLTRVAASSTEMWCDIFLANAAPAESAIAAVIRQLETLRQAIVAGDAPALQALLSRAQSARRQWSESAT